jgi:hypothetical protein
MKTKLFSIFSILIIGVFVPNLLAQTSAKPKYVKVNKTILPIKKPYQIRKIDTVKNTDFSLNGQYRFMLSRSKSSYGAKLINPIRLDAVWRSVNDTLRKERAELKNAKAKVVEQEKTINNLKLEVSGKENILNDTTAKADEISFLGISFTKSTYNIIVWSMMVVLAISLLIVIARSTKNILEAKHRTQLYEEISSEYQAYKAKSNEQQRKLARELQDERNIIEEMKSKGK